MTFPAEVNGSPLYQDGEGGEAFLFFEPGRVCLVTDIHGKGSPHNAVRLTPEVLRHIADMIEEIHVA